MATNTLFFVVVACLLSLSSAGIIKQLLKNLLVVNSTSSSVLKYDLSLILRALTGSVSIVNVKSLYSKDVLRSCRRRFGANYLNTEQHANEYHIIHNLQDKKSASRFLVTDNNNLSRPEIFYIVAIYPSLHAICDTFDGLDSYWKAVRQELISSQVWSRNRGFDHIIPASHPVVRPRHTFENRGEFWHAGFLSVDLDLRGSSIKDIIIPYNFVSPERKPNSQESSSLVRAYLLSFIGTTRESLRSEVKRVFSSDVYQDVYVSDELVSANKYFLVLRNSKFCLITRGDTSSSRRFFEALAYGCIPVILSNYVALPYENVLDYSQFTIQFDESIVFRSPDRLIDILRSIPEIAITRYSAAMVEAATYLSYHSKSVINPTTLLFVEALLARLKSCENIYFNFEVSASKTALNQASSTTELACESSLCCPAAAAIYSALNRAKA